MDKKLLIEKINKLKKEKNAVVLAHCYQRPEIDEVADFVGDSLFLSREAAKTDAEIVVFAGVYFMAETAKILSPNKKVLLPNLDAGCEMADMINLIKIREFKLKHPNIPVVCYVNSTAEVKAECDVCCTSANAVNVVKALGVKKVLFVPDRNLGSYVQSQLKDVEVICFDGYCPIHNDITVQEIEEKIKLYPNAKVLVHPECRAEILAYADEVGSTTKILKTVAESNDNEFIIVTEQGVTDRLKRDFPNKTIVSISPNAICKSMKFTSLEDILACLEEDKNEITVYNSILESAYKPIEKMISIS